MCPFGEATQKEGGGSTRLGTWQGFGDNYTTMLFDKGVGCWQGPARSFQVAPKAPQPTELVTCTGAPKGRQREGTRPTGSLIWGF